MRCLLVIAALTYILSCKSKTDGKSEIQLKADVYYKILKPQKYSASTYTAMATYIEKFHNDSSKRKEAWKWLKEEKQKEDNKVIFTRGFEILDVLKLQEECKYTRKHYLAMKLTDNEDTLRKAVEILVSTIYNQVIEDCAMRKTKSAGVFLYESEKEFKRQRYFSMATLFQFGVPEVRVIKNLE